MNDNVASFRSAEPVVVCFIQCQHVQIHRSGTCNGLHQLKQINLTSLLVVLFASTVSHTLAFQSVIITDTFIVNFLKNLLYLGKMTKKKPS